MEYRIIKIFNNNVILAEQKHKQMILVSKGIGFGKRAGDIIEANTNIEKVFHEFPKESEDIVLNEINELTLKIKGLTHKIIEIAEEKLGTLNEHSEKMLEEHIEFAIERLGMGLTIENPFIDEIVTLYTKEYEIAGIARDCINEAIGIDIGEEEQGFIALHLCSARKNKSINEIMTITRIYKECLEIVEREFDINIEFQSSFKKEFLNMLKFYINYAKGSNLFNLAIKKEVTKALKPAYKAANQIALCLKKQKHIEITDDMKAFMAVDIQKLVSLK